MVPNISKLLAVTAGSVESNVSSGKDAGFFIVVDCLVETLEQIIERWRNHHGTQGTIELHRIRLGARHT
jgi:hypothetical protein